MSDQREKTLRRTIVINVWARPLSLYDHFDTRSELSFRMKGLLILLPTLLFIAETAEIRNGTKILLSVQAMWRHGDRSPTKTYKGDYYQEAAWTFGGSGWGQLSPVS